MLQFQCTENEEVHMEGCYEKKINVYQTGSFTHCGGSRHCIRWMRRNKTDCRKWQCKWCKHYDRDGCSGWEHHPVRAGGRYRQQRNGPLCGDDGLWGRKFLWQGGAADFQRWTDGLFEQSIRAADCVEGWRSDMECWDRRSVFSFYKRALSSGVSRCEGWDDSHRRHG